MYVLLVLCVVMFFYGSEQALRIEGPQRANSKPFDYVNPVYIMNVMEAIMGAAVGGLTLIEIEKYGEQQVEERNLQKS
jgi:hypothetical protein